jgi:pimeloyl-ACP methyl ester carboxylesterase
MFEPYFEDTRQTDGTTLARILRLNMTFRLPDNLKNAGAPSLVIVGQQEYGLMKGSAGDVVKALPNAQGYIVKGVGHTFSIQKPELYASLIMDWIGDRPLPESELLKL